MPVIVVGADTPGGETIVAALLARRGEVRAFVTDPGAGAALRKQGAKVAVGDLSDGSHLAAAAYQAFTAVLVTGAAGDGRPLNFAGDATEVLAAWGAALREAGVQRAIWVGNPDPSLVGGSAPEAAVVDPTDQTDEATAGRVADLNDRNRLLPES